jgi:protein-disulfide isomerase
VNTIIRKFLGPVIGAASLIGVGAALTMPSLAAESGAFDAAQKEAIRAIVKEYLLEQPEILREAIGELNKRQEMAAEEERKKALASLYKEETPFSTGDGKVTVVEFFDYNCGYCRKAFQNLVDLSKQEKDVRVVFVEFPILSEESRLASQAAIASAKQNKYFEFHQALMAHSGRIDETVIFAEAKKVGMDVDKLKADMKAPEVDALIEKNLQLGTAMGVQGTPAIFVGDQAIPGAPEDLTKILAAAVTGIREKGCSIC